MRRMQLIEIHDQPWFPRFLRDQVTDALQIILHLGNFYQPIVAPLRRALEISGAHQILDLCSGAGGPWLWLYKSLYKDFDLQDSPMVSVCLTDKYPNAPAFARAQTASGDKIHFHAAPVDVNEVPPDLDGFRTLFASFHHFPSREAQAILQDAVNRQQGIGIFEVPGRHFLTILLTFLVPDCRICSSCAIPAPLPLVASSSGPTRSPSFHSGPPLRWLGLLLGASILRSRTAELTAHLLFAAPL